MVNCKDRPEYFFIHGSVKKDMMNKTAVITGAAGGIGKAAALHFAQAGWQTALCCRQRTQELEALAARIRCQYGTACLTFTGDMGSWEDSRAFCDMALKAFGHADVLINNAGISYIGLLTDMQPEDWRALMSSNLDSVFNCCRHIIPSMVSRKEGRIINVSSVWGCCGASCEASYSASKGGVNALTMALARELAPSNIAVNAIAFGVIDTRMNGQLSEEERAELAQEIPAGRFASPEEAGRQIFALAQADPYLTGQIIKYDGAWT